MWYKSDHADIFMRCGFPNDCGHRDRGGDDEQDFRGNLFIDVLNSDVQRRPRKISKIFVGYTLLMALGLPADVDYYISKLKWPKDMESPESRQLREGLIKLSKNN